MLNRINQAEYRHYWLFLCVWIIILLGQINLLGH